MKPFLKDVYDGDKDRRYGMLFFGTLFGLVGAVSVSGFIFASVGRDDFKIYILPFLPGVGILFIALGLLWLRHERKRRQMQNKFASLSRDELLKARSKLRNGASLTRPVKISAPDIDLKY